MQLTDFSVVLFRSDFILFSEKNRMKVHKNQWVLTMPYPLEAFLKPQAEVKPWPLGGRSLHSGYALRNSQVRCTHNLLCTKHFHGVPSARPHAYSLKSRYGKVRIMPQKRLWPFWMRLSVPSAQPMC